VGVGGDDLSLVTLGADGGLGAAEALGSILDPVLDVVPSSAGQRDEREAAHPAQFLV
jgi:hypothetical protein